jgi:hypothetical protein
MKVFWFFSSEKNILTFFLMEHDLVPDRACGTCNVCCVALTIDDPALQKVQGYRCRNTLPDKSCAIYENRPHTCRTFFCGWRLLKWVREPLRPDGSGVLVRLHEKSVGGDTEESVVFMLLNRAALKAEGLAESIAAAVAAGIPTFLNVPGPPGHTSAIGRLNESLETAVLTKDKAALLRIVRQAWSKAQSGKFEPIRLAPRQ